MATLKTLVLFAFCTSFYLPAAPCPSPTLAESHAAEPSTKSMIPQRALIWARRCLLTRWAGCWRYGVSRGPFLSRFQKKKKLNRIIFLLHVGPIQVQSAGCGWRRYTLSAQYITRGSRFRRNHLASAHPWTVIVPKAQCSI